jgi:hypothetical protein
MCPPAGIGSEDPRGEMMSNKVMRRKERFVREPTDGPYLNHVDKADRRAACPFPLAGRC